MRRGLAPLLAGCLTAAAALAAGCGHPPRASDSAGRDAAEANLSPDEKARRSCRIAFTLCAPPGPFGETTEVEELSIRGLVQVASRLDLPDALSRAAGRRLRQIAERGDAAQVQAIAEAAESAASALGKCRCEDDRFRPEFEKQRIAEIVAGRLPPAALREPGYWAGRIDGHLGKLRALSRRSAELLAAGDDPGRVEIDEQAAKELRDLCETVHAARDVLKEQELGAMRNLVYQARARAAGDASLGIARGLLEQAERSPSCPVAAAPPDGAAR